MTITESITLSIAVLGAVLGLINTVYQLDRSRIKLRVTPKHVTPVGAANPNLTFCIEVTNLSSFPVTIEEVGVFLTQTTARMSYLRPVLPDGGPWPRRLEPRSSVSVYGETPVAKHGHSLKCAYARTSCGITRKGSSPIFKQLAANHAL
jgi:hypothetical protein